MNEILELNDNNFSENVFTSNKPIVIAFTADWCSICKSFDPSLQNLNNIYGNKIRFGKVNIDESFALANRFQVSKLPTFIIFNKNEIDNVIIGALSEEKFKKILDGLLNK